MEHCEPTTRYNPICREAGFRPQRGGRGGELFPEQHPSPHSFSVPSYDNHTHHRTWPRVTVGFPALGLGVSEEFFVLSRPVAACLRRGLRRETPTLGLFLLGSELLRSW